MKCIFLRPRIVILVMFINLEFCVELEFKYWRQARSQGGPFPLDKSESSIIICPIHLILIHFAQNLNGVFLIELHFTTIIINSIIRNPKS